MSECGESVWHHAGYTGDAQYMSLAGLCPCLFFLPRRRTLGQVSPQTLPIESGQRRSASWGWAWFRGHVFIGAGKQATEPSPQHCDLHTMSLIFWPSVFSFTGHLLGASAVSARLFPHQENPVVFGASIWPDSPVDRSSHVTWFWPRRRRCRLWWAGVSLPEHKGKARLKKILPTPNLARPSHA